MGDIHGGFREASEGHIQDALRYHLIALGFWQALVDASPDDGELHIRLAVCHIRIGDALKHTGKLSEAEAEYRLAFDSLDAVTEPEPRRFRAAALQSLGAVLLELGRADDAENEFQRALQISTELVRDDPQGRNRRNLAVSWIKIGEFGRATGKYDDALASFNKALGIRDRLLEKAAPNDSKARERVAKAELAVGVTYLDLGRPDDAKRPLQRAHDLFLDRANANPDVPSAQLDLARSRMALGRVSLAHGEPDEALTAFASARAIVLGLVDRTDTTNFPETLAQTHQLTAEALTASGDVGGALDESQEALGVLSRNTASGSESVDLVAFRAELHTALGQLLLAEERWSEAEQYLAWAHELYESLDDNSLKLAPVRDGLATTLHTMSRLQIELGETDEAVKLAEQALALLKDAHGGAKVATLRRELVDDLDRWRQSSK
jgi:tetratricopeptide (TPR) repeat protein